MNDAPEMAPYARACFDCTGHYCDPQREADRLITCSAGCWASWATTTTRCASSAARRLAWASATAAPCWSSTRRASGITVFTRRACVASSTNTCGKGARSRSLSFIALRK